MRKQKIGKYGVYALLAVAVAISGARTAFAEGSSSSHYQVTETTFNSGASLESCSGSYCAHTTIGETGSGESTGTTQAANFGSVTPDVPSLDVIVETGLSDLGELSTTRTASKTMIVKIRSYLSDGYTFQIIGDAPKYGEHTLSTPSTPTASQKGVEQFAINAAANSTPNIGADPVQVPSDQLSFGKVDDDYKQANLFKYSSGDVIGRSLTESGQTEYTISMIVNIANSTPAGHYAGDFAAVVVPIY